MALAAGTGELPYSIEECGAYPYASGTPGAFVDVVGIAKMDSKAATVTAEVRGDNTVLATSAAFSSMDVTLEIHQLHLASIAAVAGGTFVLVGTTPNQVNTLTRNVLTDVVADYKLAGQTHSKDASGKAVRLTFNRCQWQSGPDWGLDDNAFATVTVACKAIGDATGIIFLVQQYETYAAIA